MLSQILKSNNRVQATLAVMAALVCSLAYNLAVSSTAQADQDQDEFKIDIQIDVTDYHSYTSQVTQSRQTEYVTQSAHVNKIRNLLVPALHYATIQFLADPNGAAQSLRAALQQAKKEVATNYPYGMPHTIQAVKSSQEIIDAIFRAIDNHGSDTKEDGAKFVGSAQGRVKFVAVAQYVGAVIWASKLDSHWYWKIVNSWGDSREEDLPNEYFKGFSKLASTFLKMQRSMQELESFNTVEAKAVLAVAKSAHYQMINQSLFKRKLRPVAETLYYLELKAKRDLAVPPVQGEDISELRSMIVQARRQIWNINYSN